MSSGKPRIGPKRAKQLQTLDDCIPHWEAIVAKDPDHRPEAEECACCQQYMLESDTGACEGCPIYEDTCLHACSGTPFDEASREHYYSHDGPVTHRKRMLDYLVDLRQRLSDPRVPARGGR